MFLFINQLIWVISLGVVVLLLARKIPALLALPETTSSSENKKGFFKRAFNGEKVAKPKPYKNKEVKLKKAAKASNKKQQIDIDEDYWSDLASKVK